MDEWLTSGGGRLSRVDVADNDDVDMSLFLTADEVSLNALKMWENAELEMSQSSRLQD